MDINLKQLRAVVAVAEERNFTQAAQRLGRSQQAISTLVRDLELSLGTRLFDRSTRVVVPTPACEALVAESRWALGIIEAALLLAAGTGIAERRLVLAITPAVAFGELKLLLDELEGLGVHEPDVREIWADEMMAGLLAGSFDAGISVEPGRVPAMDTLPWCTQRVDLLVSEQHEWAKRAAVEVAELDQTTLIIPGQRTNIGLAHKLLETLARASVRPRLIDVARVAGPPPVEVERGLAATIWLTSMDDRYLPAGFVRLPLIAPETLTMTYLIVPQAPRYLHPAVATLRDVIGLMAKTRVRDDLLV